MSEVAATPEGQTIEGRYRIVRRIAEGGMATVYEAVDTRLERRVAIKIMHTQLAQGTHRAQFVERFRREAKSAAAIANPHIVQVYDTGEFNGLDYLVMEYVHGVNLRHDMNLQGTFSVRETLRIVSETLDGLAAAHRVGVVHRDIKPENILINDRGHVQITDFGLAKAASQATLSSTGMLLGTAAYLAPEMIEDNQATMQGDLYSVGIMAWEMLDGDVPFISDNPVTMVFKHVHEDVPSLTTVCPGIDPHVAAFVSHLTARAVDERPADAADALQELRQMTARLPMDAWLYRKPAHEAPVNGQTEANGQANANDMRDATAPALVGALPTPPIPPLFPSDVAASQNNAATTVLTADVNGANGGGADTLSVTSVTDDAGFTIDTLPGGAQSGSNTTSPRVAPAKPKPTAIMTPDGNDAHPSPNDAATQVIDGIGTRQPTQVIGLMDAKPVNGTHADAGAAQHANGRTRRRGRKPLIITLVVVLALAAAGGGTGAWWYYLGPGSYWTLPKPNDVTCASQADCSIVGAAWNDYRSTLNVANIPFTVSEEYSDTVEKGAIISASPKQVGARISKRHDGRVTVTVSLGVKQATVPAGVDDPMTANGRDPITALKAAGFTNITEDKSKEEYSMDLAEGVVQSISVKPGETLDHNTAITVVLSKGPMPVTMPDIIGKTKDEAMTALDNARLKTTITEQNSDSVAAGSVISASPDSGTQLHWGDSAELVISKGPQTADVPNLVGKSKADATKTLESLGFEVKTNGLDILGLVQQQSASGKTRLRDKDGKKTVITLTVV